MQVLKVNSAIVAACNGGCDTFDINRSLASGVADLNPLFSNMPLSMLVLGIMSTQSTTKFSSSQSAWSDFASDDNSDTQNGK